MATKTPGATIDFLMACMEHTDGKTDWEAVATTTGMYKEGKFSAQAFKTLQKKHAEGKIGGATSAAAKDVAGKAKKPAAKSDKPATKVATKSAPKFVAKSAKAPTKSAKNQVTASKKRAAGDDFEGTISQGKKAKQEDGEADADDADDDDDDDDDNSDGDAELGSVDSNSE